MSLHFCQTLMEEIWASCCMLVAAHREVTKKKKQRLCLRSGMLSAEVTCMSGSAFQWTGLMRGIWHTALKGVNPSSSQD